MRPLTIPQLYSGGIITNYSCTSKCQHCLYGCSPLRSHNYITKSQAVKNMQQIIHKGCRAVHIGGGEPFVDVQGLYSVLNAANEVKMRIEYIETNSSWCTNIEKGIEILTELKKRNVRQLLISMSPFHNEHVPFIRVKNLMAACKEVKISVFPWIEEFYDEINSFEDHHTHNLEEYQKKFGKGYLLSIPKRYWIHYGGRVLKTYAEIAPTLSLESIINNPLGCSELTDVSHFHIDLYGNYIPGLCSGLSIKEEDLNKAISPEKYPFLTMLYNHGIKKFYEYAKDEYNFKADNQYLNKCHLCFDIRQFLVKDLFINTIEFQPSEFYQQL